MIKLTDEYYYEIEAEQYVLIHKYMKKKGVFGKNQVESDEMIEKTEEIGYFISLQYMLRRLAQILVKERYDKGEINSLQEHIDILVTLEEKLMDMCKGR